MSILRAGDAVMRVPYKCAQCDAADTGKFFTGEIPAPAINCWSCGAGRGKDLGEMLATHRGMFPVIVSPAASALH